MKESEASQPIKVRVIYRNYRPIHQIYQTLIDNPPPGVEYSVSAVKTRLRSLLPLYRRFRYFALGRWAIGIIEKLFFLKKTGNDSYDLYHYICMIDTKTPNKPYVVDVDHAASLVSYTYNLGRLNQVKAFLQNPNCKSINCLSQAANRTLKDMLGADYAKIVDKVHIVYASVSAPDAAKSRPDYKYIKVSAKLKILFVGNRAYLKGLEEMLEAIKAINQRYSRDRLEAHIISNDAGEIVDKYKLPNVFLYEPEFNQQQMITQFYMTADVLISPTKQDVYGMSLIESLASGTPVIASRQFAIPELVTDGSDGYLLKLQKAILDDALMPDRKNIVAIHHSNLDLGLVRQITKLLAEILDGKIDLKKMGVKGRLKFMPGGKLAASTRNQKLLDIYQKALN